jgi:hypothetical protein
MNSRDRARKRLSWLALAALPWLCAESSARVLQVDVERTSFALGRLDRLALRLDWPDGASQGAVELRAAVLDAPELGYRFRELRWTCTLERRAAGDFHCEGPLRAQDAGRATLAATWTSDGLQLALSRAGGRFALALPRAADAAVQLNAERLPLPWLQPLLAERWQQARLTTGTLDAALELRQTAPDASELAGPLQFTGLGLDTSDGRIAAADVDASGRMRLGLLARGTEIDVDLDLRGGEWLVGSLYAALPETAVALALGMRSTSAGGWDLVRLGWKDGAQLDVSGSGALDQEGALDALDLRFASTDLATAHRRYLDSLLATFGLPGLALEGALEGRAALRDAAPVEVDLTLARVSARDGGERFALHELEGTLRWTAGGEARDSDLSWTSAQLGAIGIGAARLPLRSTQRGLVLREPIELALLGGRLRLPRLAWTPTDSEQRGTRLDVAIELQGLDVAQLCRALDWPAFSGTLSGRIPGVRYADEVLSLDGGLAVDVFGGKVEIASMTLERPFGVAPTTAGDLVFDDLDLQPLTGAFGFGEITGRLDGHIRGLRLVDWSPVAFDAMFRTDPDARDERRISQRAVNDLTRVGGGGIAAGLQNQVLKLFDTFGYRRIGLSCRLANNVCTMGGVDSSGTGYTIVEGAGLPRVSVIGHQRQVDWPVLVARLKAATEGQVPIVN